MQKWLESNGWRRIWVHRSVKIEIQKGEPNNSDILQMWFPPEIRFPLFTLQKFQYSWFMHKWLKSNGWRGICVHRTFKIEIQKSGSNNSDILENWFPPEIRSPLFNLPKFQDNDKSTPDSCRNDLNLMNDEEFGSILLLWLKYRRRATK